VYALVVRGSMFAPDRARAREGEQEGDVRLRRAA
jgi:hypothetical protein